MERFILEDGYVSQGTRKSKPIEYVLDENDCYICISHNSNNKTGYYRIRRYGNLIDMHVWINDVYNDKKSQKGFVVRHLCGNSRCINPSHLKVGTYSENEEDKRVEGKMPHAGEQNGHSKLTERDVYEIKYILKNNSLSMYRLSKIYDVSQTSISDIKKGIGWKHVII